VVIVQNEQQIVSGPAIQAHAEFQKADKRVVATKAVINAHIVARVDQVVAGPALTGHAGVVVRIVGSVGIVVWPRIIIRVGSIIP